MSAPAHPSLPCFPCPHASACCAYGVTLSDEEAWHIVRYIRHLPARGSLGAPAIFKEEEEQHARHPRQGSGGILGDWLPECLHAVCDRLNASHGGAPRSECSQDQEE